MYYNYFDTENFNRLRESLGFTKIQNSIYIGPYKYIKFLDNKLLFNLFKFLFPITYVEKDLSLTDIRKKVYGLSFKKIKNAKEYNTFIIDLEKELNLDRSIKKNINKAQDFKVSIISSKVELKEYYKAYKDFRKSHGFRYDSYYIVEKMFDILGDNYKIFIAKKDHKIYSALGIIINYDEKQFIEVSAVRTKESKYDNDLLKYQIIQWGIKNNLRYYDLAGVDLNNEGIFRYKKKWGGELTKYYVYENF